MGLLKINGIKLFVERQGKGVPLLIIHGIGGNHEVHLRPVLGPLSKNFTVVAPDCRGHGKSDKPGTFTLEDHTSDMIGIIDHFGFDKVHVLGISMGSYIAQSLALTAPAKVDKLILTVTKSNGLTSSTDRLFKAHQEEAAGLDKGQSLQALLKYMVCDPHKMARHLDVFGTDLSPQQLAAANRAISEFDFRPRLNEIKSSSLVISGRCDGLNPPEEGKEVASLIKGSLFEVMQHSGHAPMFEETEAFINLVTRFLQNDRSQSYS